MPAPVRRSVEARDVLLLFSGGSDSTLAAVRAYEKFETVRLVTFLREGLIHAEHVEERVARLRRFMGDAGAYAHRFIRTDRLFERILYDDYLGNLRRHGTLVLSHCGLCKLAFHWRALLLCLEQGIRNVWDGAVRTAQVYPEQNETILLGPLRELYALYGIRYECPVYEEGASVSESLCAIGFHRAPAKGTAEDRQLICTQQVLFAMFLRWSLPKGTFADYERSLAGFYRSKIELVRAWTDEWLAAGGGASRLGPLIES